MFNPQELRALASFLDRTNIQGNEAVYLATLQQKIAKLFEEATKPKDDGKGTGDK
jgi:hypothetical protein